MINDFIKIIICIFGIIVTGATQAILIPILTMYFDSLFYILFNTGVQLIIIFGTLFFFLNGRKFSLPPYKRFVFQSGLFNAFMGICQVYSANPERTPPVLQSILAGLAIVPSIILTKYFLEKKVLYNFRFVVPSMILLIASLVIPIAYIGNDWHWESILWTLLYTSGIVFRGTFNIMQEKYLTESADPTLNNKVMLLFYSRSIQFVFIVLSFPLEYVIGYEANPFTEFLHSCEQFFTDYKGFILLEVFIIAYLLIYGFSVYLNSISTNYNMISTAAINPSVAVFFTVFKSLNPGMHFPLGIVISSLICSVMSVILWIFGEKKTTYEKL